MINEVVAEELRTSGLVLMDRRRLIFRSGYGGRGPLQGCFFYSTLPIPIFHFFG